MLRSAIMLLTIVATIIGSLGLPLYLHSCPMVSTETSAAGCPMCQTTKSEPSERNAEDHARCCTDYVIHQLIDDGTMYRSDVAMPACTGIIALALFDLTAPLAPAPTTGARSHSPPGAAVRTQLTYLHNSSFLI